MALIFITDAPSVPSPPLRMQIVSFVQVKCYNIKPHSDIEIKDNYQALPLSTNSDNKYNMQNLLALISAVFLFKLLVLKMPSLWSFAYGH